MPISRKQSISNGRTEACNYQYQTEACNYQYQTEACNYQYQTEACNYQCQTNGHNLSSYVSTCLFKTGNDYALAVNSTESLYQLELYLD